MRRTIASVLLILTASFFLSKEAQSTHLMGGNLTYEYLGDTDSDGNFNYRITFKTYINCNSPFWGAGFPEPNLTVGIYEGVAAPIGTTPLIMNINMPLFDSTKIELNLPDSTITEECFKYF